MYDCGNISSHLLSIVRKDYRMGLPRADVHDKLEFDSSGERWMGKDNSLPEQLGRV